MSKFSMLKSIALTGALVAGVSGIARADDTARQYQGWSSDSSVWKINAPVFDNCAFA